MTEKGRYKDKSGKSVSNEAANAAKRYAAEFAGFVNVHLNEETKERFATWVDSIDVYEEFDRNIAAGRKITVTYDFANQAAQASIFERDTKSPNAGKICSMRGKEGITALLRVMYVCGDTFPEDWSKSAKADDGW